MSEPILTKIHPQMRTKWFYQPPAEICNFNNKKYIEGTIRWREDMNFIFECQINILLTSAASE